MSARVPATSRRLLVAILLVALAVRAWGLGFGLPFYNARVDESTMASPAVGFLSGDLNPHDFMYPTAFRYTLAAMYATWYLIASPFGIYSSLEALANRRFETIAPFFYMDRGLSVLMGTLTVWWVFLICRRVFDETIAIVAAFFMALAYLHVRDSHFGTSDVTMIGLVMLSLLSIVRWQATGTLARAAVAGLLVGLAASVKYNGLGAGVPFAVAVVERLFVKDRAARISVARAAGLLSLFGAAVLVGFFGTSPYALIDWHRFVTDVANQGAILAQGHGLRTTRGWIHHGAVNLPAALGWPLYTAALGGVVGLLITRWRQAIVLLAFPLAYYAVTGSGYRVFARDSLPNVPFLCIAAAWLISTLIQATVGASRRTAVQWSTGALAIALVAPSALDVWRLDRIFVRDDTRVIAARTLPSLITPWSLIYQSGAAYGHVPFDVSRPQFVVDECTFDEATNEFAPSGTLPAWIILPRSPLVVYSHVPEGVERIVQARYDLVLRIPATTDDHPRVYDQQDALFLPLSDLSGVFRLGPSVEVYRLRGAR
jgi:4-amino-4-deoxy-L-arabinose transferase-like glycosyltransferase